MVNLPIKCFMIVNYNASVILTGKMPKVGLYNLYFQSYIERL